MDSVVENRVYKEQRHTGTPAHKIEMKKKKFEDAVVECDGRPASEFFNELRRQVKEHFNNA